MGIRPQDIYTDRTAPPDAILSEPIHAVVDVVEPHGDRNDVHLLIDGATAIAQLSARVKASEGELLPVRLHLEYLHLFDPDTDGKPSSASSRLFTSGSAAVDASRGREPSPAGRRHLPR
jgi:hypothetical protein